MEGKKTWTELLVSSKSFCKEKKLLREWLEKEKHHYSRPHQVGSSGLQPEAVTVMTACLMLKLSRHTGSSLEMEKLVETRCCLDST